MDSRTRRSPGRFLGPLALIAVVVALMMIVNGSGKSGSSSSATDTSAATTTSKTTATKTSTAKTKTTKATSGSGKTYTVQVGDTFGGIADKTGVPLDRLQTLNPAVDAHAMTVGQKIKLK